MLDAEEISALYQFVLTKYYVAKHDSKVFDVHLILFRTSRHAGEVLNYGP